MPTPISGRRSPKYLLGEMSFDRLMFRPEEWYAENNVDIRLSTWVEEIDRAGKTVRMQDGSTLSYARLVLATGAAPRLLPASIGGDLDGVLTVRDRRDADRLTEEMKPGRRLLVIGGGYIGLEAAAVARKLGLEVTLIEMADRILQRVAAKETADIMRGIHQAQGVSIREKPASCASSVWTGGLLRPNFQMVRRSTWISSSSASA